RWRYKLFRDLQQPNGELNQFLLGQAAVSVVHRLSEGVRDPGADTHHRRPLDPEPEGDRIGGLEANTANVACEPIWVFGHHLNRIGAMGLIDPNSASRADTVAVQQD